MVTYADAVTTTRVFLEGKWHECLVYVMNRHRIRDVRVREGVFSAMEKDLGITGDPKWYQLIY